MLSKLKLINLVFLHNYLESKLGDYKTMEENQILDLVERVH